MKEHPSHSHKSRIPSLQSGTVSVFLSFRYTLIGSVLPYFSFYITGREALRHIKKWRCWLERKSPSISTFSWYLYSYIRFFLISIVSHTHIHDTCILCYVSMLQTALLNLSHPHFPFIFFFLFFSTHLTLPYFSIT